ncbi:MAG: DUF6159 family protein [Vicinamibacterales bacterium]
MGRIGRSFQLVGQSYRVLMQDKELMILPLISGSVIVTAVAAFTFGFGVDSEKLQQRGPELYVPLFLMYVVTYTVGIFFQAAVIAGATQRMRGGDPTIKSALAAAASRIGAIVMWAVVAATVGMILRAIHDRAGFVGKIIASLLGAAWSLATFFVVPVLVLEERTVGESYSRSTAVFKQTWGETVVGGINLAVAAVCSWVTLVAVSGLLAMLIGTPALAVFAMGAVCLMVFFSALQGVYVASLYRYATDGQTAPGFDKAIFEQAFRPKNR